MKLLQGLFWAQGKRLLKIVLMGVKAAYTLMDPLCKEVPRMLLEPLHHHGLYGFALNPWFFTDLAITDPNTSTGTIVGQSFIVLQLHVHARCVAKHRPHIKCTAWRDSTQCTRRQWKIPVESAPFTVRLLSVGPLTKELR
jgi:hypothetical protein